MCRLPWRSDTRGSPRDVTRVSSLGSLHRSCTPPSLVEPPSLKRPYPQQVLGRSVVIPCFSKICAATERFSCNNFSIFCSGRWSMDCCLRPIGQRPNRMWPGWDQRPWPRSVWSGLSRFVNILIRTSSLAKTCRSVRRPGQAHIDGSAGLLPCQPGRQCTGPRRSSSFARHDTLASSPRS